jgi:hypothetical protein
MRRGAAGLRRLSILKAGNEMRTTPASNDETRSQSFSRALENLPPMAISGTRQRRWMMRQFNALRWSTAAGPGFRAASGALRQAGGSRGARRADRRTGPGGAQAGGDLNAAWFQAVATYDGDDGTYASQHLQGGIQAHYDRASSMVDARDRGQSIYSVGAQSASSTLWNFWMGN